MYTDGFHTDRWGTEKFPFHGVFYQLAETINEDGSYDLDDEEEDAVSDDGSYDLSEDEEEEADTDSSAEADDATDSSGDSGIIVILETPCDIQRNNALIASSTITRGYKVYFPFDPEKAELPSGLKPGILFRGEAYGLTIAGTVLDPVASQLGGCMVEIEGSDI